jgi:hypothetical protein
MELSHVSWENCSGMASGDGPREAAAALWETLNGVEHCFRTSATDVPLLMQFGRDHRFVPPQDFATQELQSPIMSSSSALVPAVYSSGMDLYVSGEVVNRVTSASRDSSRCIQTAILQNRPLHSIATNRLSTHNLWPPDAGRDQVCASVPALVTPHTESHGYEQIEKGEFEAQLKENKVVQAVQERIPIRNANCKTLLGQVEMQWPCCNHQRPTTAAGIITSCQCQSSLHGSPDHDIMGATQLAENLEPQDVRQYPGSHLVMERTQNTGQEDVWECTMDQLEEHEEVEGGCEQMSAGAFMSRNLVSERNRRKKLNKSLYSLRSVVPHISKVRFYVSPQKRCHFGACPLLCPKSGNPCL